MKANAPCLNCERRVVGCHSTCDAYKAYKDEKLRRWNENGPQAIADAYFHGRASECANKQIKAGYRPANSFKRKAYH